MQAVDDRARRPILFAADTCDACDFHPLRQVGRDVTAQFRWRLERGLRAFIDEPLLGIRQQQDYLVIACITVGGALCLGLSRRPLWIQSL